nr:unnamed protein product [Digitaria exilis]
MDGARFRGHQSVAVRRGATPVCPAQGAAWDHATLPAGGLWGPRAPPTRPACSPPPPLAPVACSARLLPVPDDSLARVKTGPPQQQVRGGLPGKSSKGGGRSRDALVGPHPSPDPFSFSSPATPYVAVAWARAGRPVIDRIVMVRVSSRKPRRWTTRDEDPSSQEQGRAIGGAQFSTTPGSVGTDYREIGQVAPVLAEFRFVLGPRMMYRVKSESDCDMLLPEQMDSPVADDGSSGGGSPHRGSGPPLKKGPWTSAEDAILVDYVKKHGEGNWNAVQKNTGLLRCGKSCRLRWANHLRPNLKKGAFTPEEERLIIQLHAKMGNKWARMAAHVSAMLIPSSAHDHAVLYPMDQFSNDSEKLKQALVFDYLNEANASSKGIAPFGVALSGSHAFLNGNFSASRPINGPLKMELPSLQDTESDPNSWLKYTVAPAMQPTELVDPYLHSPIATPSPKSECASPRNSGLLEELLHEAQALRSGKNQLPSVRSSSSSAGTPCETTTVVSPEFDLCHEYWDEHHSSFLNECAHFSGYSFTESTPISGASPDIFQLSKISPAQSPSMGSGEQAVEPKQDTAGSSLPENVRPDALISGNTADPSTFNNAIAILLGNDTNAKCKSVRGDGIAFGSSSWSNMPRASQMSEFK